MKMKAVILTAMMLIMFMTGGSSQAATVSPESSMEKACNAFLYLDEADLKTLNLSAEDMRAKYGSIFRNLNDEIIFTDEQTNAMTDAFIDTIHKKIKFEIKTESVNGDKAVVAVKITGINFNKAMSEVSFDATGLTDEQISEVFTQKIIEAIENVSAEKPVTVKFNCEFDEEANFWIPEGDSENNLNPLFNAAFNFN